ncbi:MAG: methyltransferase domain-containing protein [Velocimicrobium sp.]
MEETKSVIRDTYEQIQKGIEVRQNLSLLRKILKEGKERHAFLYFLSGDYSLFETLLQHEDPKVRKNVALIMGELDAKDLLKPLYEAYEKEETLFVKSSYLLAIKEYDFREYATKLKQRLNEISSKEISLEHKKHMTEELRVLSDMMIMLEGVKPHKFKGEHIPSEYILLTNRNHILKIIDKLPDSVEAKPFNAGIIVKTDSLEQMLELRYYEELLFVVNDIKTCPMNPEEAARKIAESNIVTFIKDRHQGKAPFYFRIECKSRLALDKKSALTKKLSSELERLTSREFVNSTSNYEFEIRLIENKSGAFNVLVKLFTLEDTRFMYRKEVIASSIKPVNAALSCLLASDYLKDDAKILDPFCGTGTMLIERHKFRKANTMYGIDLYGEAIEKAKVNTEGAHQIIHYINRDFFDFKHEYLFDEIISDMPFTKGKSMEADIQVLYEKFFQKAKIHLNPEGIIVLYSHNRELVKKLSTKNGYMIKEEYEISKKEGTYLYVLKI